MMRIYCFGRGSAGPRDDPAFRILVTVDAPLLSFRGFQNSFCDDILLYIRTHVERKTLIGRYRTVSFIIMGIPPCSIQRWILGYSKRAHHVCAL